MTVVTLESTKKLPAGLRSIISQHLAVPRWSETCDFYNRMSERERLTVCFHARLKQRHAMAKLEEMNDADRERVVCTIAELSRAFAEYRKHGISKSGFIRRLTISERRTLFRHAGLTDSEFSQPYWHMDDDTCLWREKLFRALRELFSLFRYAPTVLTAVRPEQYLH